MTYRNDIDGLRAYAVFAVIFFHLGLLPNGYLGVDIFFVISGFLITNIIYTKINDQSFSIKQFYLRRIKRIIPLTTFITIFSIILGYFTMLPDDLENLSQSVIATNFFGNNILSILTTKNYWDVVNEYKPLMHTWSLAVEEQFYFIYPFILLVTARFNVRYINPVILALTLLSIGLFFFSHTEYIRFYLLPYRFFEMSIGGFISLFFIKKLINKRYSVPTFLLLTTIIVVDNTFLSSDIILVTCAILTAILLKTENFDNKITSIFLSNKYVVFLGKISFSLYLWHQVVLAFSRYIYGETPLIPILLVTLALSIITYFFIEQPFRYSFSNNTVLTVVFTSILVSSVFSFSIYKRNGIVRDVPSLGLSLGQGRSNIHGAYNDRIYKLDRPFNDSSKIQVLIIGNSFARDWANVLLESELSSTIEVSYIYDFTSHRDLLKRSQKADFIFWSTFDTTQVKHSGVDFNKSWCIGTKNFGENNGKFYNSKSILPRTRMEDHYYQINDELKAQWGNRYLDLVDLILDENMTVPVYTPSGKFISQDCRHFTRYGARYFAELLENLPNFPITNATN